MKLNKLLPSLLITLLAGSASAAVVTLNATADLSLATTTSFSIEAGNYFGAASALPLSAPFTVATGDTFVYNLDFLGNQQLTVNGLTLAWPLVITQNALQAATIDMTGTLDLLGADNSVVATATKTNSDGSIHIAQVFFAGDFGEPASVTFAGFRYSGVVNSETVNPRTYDAPSLQFTGSSVRVSEFVNNNVPEPESLSLVGLALAGLGLTRRKAKQA